MKEIIPIPFFKPFPVSCGTTTRHFPLKVARTHQLSQEEVFLSHGLKFLNLTSAKWIQAEQVHGDTIAFVDATTPSACSAITLLENVDGLLTQRADHTLSILTADCLPIFFYLGNPPAVGLVHAGWRGTAKGIARHAVSGFKRLAKHRCHELHVAFGPSIGGCCYEVGEEFQDLFPESLEEREGRFYLDLVQENRRQLLEAGLLPGQIGPAGPCTGCHLENFYSYRKEGNRAYRMLSWILLPNSPEI